MVSALYCAHTETTPKYMFLKTSEIQSEATLNDGLKGVVHFDASLSGRRRLFTVLPEAVQKASEAEHGGGNLVSVDVEPAAFSRFSISPSTSFNLF